MGRGLIFIREPAGTKDAQRVGADIFPLRREEGTPSPRCPFAL
tara:strand:- start:4002 stop:4130 length:129 start_codon:yes stop_codon:yes gene_type:complete